METNSIVIEVTYHAHIAKVWKAISDNTEMKNWYFAIDEFRAEPGFKFHFSGGSEEKSYLHLCEVREAVENKILSYTWKYEDHPGDTLVTFELFADGENTDLRLSHLGIGSFPQDNPDFKKESFEAGWNEIIGKNLKEYVER